MNFINRIIILLFVLHSINLQAQNSDAQIIERILNEWVESFNEKNIEKSLAIYDENFIGYYPEQKEQSFNDIKEQHKSIFNNKNLSVKLDIEIVEIETSGILGFVRLILKATVKPTYATQPAVAYDKGIQIWQKNSNGVWKLKRSSTFAYSKH